MEFSDHIHFCFSTSSLASAAEELGDVLLLAEPLIKHLEETTKIRIPVREDLALGVETFDDQVRISWIWIIPIR